jgi:hypothetical protein
MAGVDVASVLADVAEPLPQTLWTEAAMWIGLPLHRIAFVLPDGQSLRCNDIKAAKSLCELLEG